MPQPRHTSTSIHFHPTRWLKLRNLGFACLDPVSAVPGTSQQALCLEAFAVGATETAQKELWQLSKRLAWSIRPTLSVRCFEGF